LCAKKLRASADEENQLCVAHIHRENSKSTFGVANRKFDKLSVLLFGLFASERSLYVSSDKIISCEACPPAFWTQEAGTFPLPLAHFIVKNV
jgi:hypothetical protein